MTIYLPNQIGHKYDLGSVIFKKVNGIKVFMRITEVHYFGYKSKDTHIKFKGKRIDKIKKLC